MRLLRLLVAINEFCSDVKNVKESNKEESFFGKYLMKN